ncbi:MAG: hypothetical protein JHC87_01765 [Thermoleophilaceae bacterium]|nr:hypothetical protein [Thermoleophilaceae bacterium]
MPRSETIAEDKSLKRRQNNVYIEFLEEAKMIKTNPAADLSGNKSRPAGAVVNGASS